MAAKADAVASDGLRNERSRDSLDVVVSLAGGGEGLGSKLFTGAGEGCGVGSCDLKPKSDKDFW